MTIHVCGLLVVACVMAACSSSGSSKATSSTTTTAGPAATSTSAAPTTTTTLPKFTGVASKQFCAQDAHLHSTFDQAFSNAQTVPVSTLQALYNNAIAAVRGMEQVASPEIKPAMTTLRTALVDAEPYMVRAHFVAAQLSTKGKAIIGGHAVSLATNRLGAYEIEVCGRSN